MSQATLQSNLNHFTNCPDMVAPLCSKKSYILNIPESQTYPGFITHLPHNISVCYSKFCTYQQHRCQQNLRNTQSSGDPFLGVSQVPREAMYSWSQGLLWICDCSYQHYCARKAGEVGRKEWWSGWQSNGSFCFLLLKISMQVSLKNLRPPVYYFLPGMQPSAY